MSSTTGTVYNLTIFPPNSWLLYIRICKLRLSTTVLIPDGIILYILLSFETTVPYEGVSLLSQILLKTNDMHPFCMRLFPEIPVAAYQERDRQRPLSPVLWTKQNCDTCELTRQSGPSSSLKKSNPACVVLMAQGKCPKNYPPSPLWIFVINRLALFFFIFPVPVFVNAFTVLKTSSEYLPWLVVHM